MLSMQIEAILIKILPCQTGNGKNACFAVLVFIN
jgi:hypothetical protein